MNKLEQHLLSNQMTWLITGVAGFIGSNLLEKLLKLNQKVVGLDNFATGFKNNLKQAITDANNPDAEALFRFIEGDICDLTTCQQACMGVDYVLHQAALGSVPRSINNPIATNRTNIDGFLNMLIASKASQVKRFVYAASSSTYGDHPDLPKIEGIIGKPLNPYAVTKLVNELYADVFAKVYGFQSIGLRYFNVFGKRQNKVGAYAAVIPKWILALINKEIPCINGDGKTSRDFCYIENAIRMNLLAATTTNKVALNAVYNVAVGDRTTLNTLFKIIQTELIKLSPNLNRVQPIYQDFREGDVRHSQADITRAQQRLGYQPSHNIHAGLKETTQWYYTHYG